MNENDFYDYIKTLKCFYCGEKLEIDYGTYNFYLKCPCKVQANNNYYSTYSCCYDRNNFNLTSECAVLKTNYNTIFTIESIVDDLYNNYFIKIFKNADKLLDCYSASPFPIKKI